MVKMTFNGREAVMAKIKTRVQETPARTGAALKAETEIEVTEMKKRTPVDTGDLRASIHAEDPVHEGRSIYCEAVAGGIADSYAEVVHEDLEAFHKVGQAKFMESVIMESARFMAARVAKRLRESE